MSTNIDIENRLLQAVIAVAGADAGIAGICGTRIWELGDQSHSADFPCTLVQVAVCAPFDYMTGWYKASVNIIAATHIMDDKSKATLKTLAGYIRGLVQSGTFDAVLNASTPAKATATALTVESAEISDSFEEPIEKNGQTIGIAVMLLARPSIGTNTG